MKKLFVANIPYSASETDISEFFGVQGKVTSVYIPKDRETEKSKGYCFVEMEKDSEAVEAISMMDGREFGGRQLVVKEATPQKKRDNKSRDADHGQKREYGRNPSSSFNRR